MDNKNLVVAIMGAVGAFLEDERNSDNQEENEARAGDNPKKINWQQWQGYSNRWGIAIKTLPEPAREYTSSAGQRRY